jgi:hypothetical protein
VPEVGQWDRARHAFEYASLPGVGRGRGIALIAACALGLVGCGSGPTFTASEFVDKVNSEGLSMELGRRLTGGADAQHGTGRADARPRIYAVRLPPLPGEPKPPPGSETGPGAAGSLYVFGDTGSAGDRLTACRGSGGLLCFQAQNIVVVLEDESSRLEAQRLAVAVRRLAER